LPPLSTSSCLLTCTYSSDIPLITLQAHRHKGEDVPGVNMARNELLCCYRGFEWPQSEQANRSGVKANFHTRNAGSAYFRPPPKSSSDEGRIERMETHSGNERKRHGLLPNRDRSDDFNSPSVHHENAVSDA
jgi:hypothetical protein